MDFKKVSEGLQRDAEIRRRLGEANWIYRCTAGHGCKDTAYVMRMPAHLLTCSCDIAYHDDELRHRNPCGARIELVERTPAAIEIDRLDGIEA